MDAQSPGDAEEVLFEGHPAVVPSVGAALLVLVTLGLAALWLWVRSRSLHLRVTTHRVVVERGLLSKTMEQVDTYRIRDYAVERPFGQRLLGTGNLTLHTMDPTSPTMTLSNLRTDVKALYERLRAAAERDQARRGVRLLDTE